MSSAEDAIRILLRYSFYELRLQKCNSQTIHNNYASIRLHKKLGFIQEDKQRRVIYTNGEFFDNIIWGQTREEFEQNDKDY